MLSRRPAKKINVGDVILGGGYPIRVQTMCTTQTADVRSTVNQILELEKVGCELIRVNVDDVQSAEAISSIKKKIHIPLIADVLFDEEIIIKAIRRGADKIRINPGKFSPQSLKRVVDEARIFRIPVRIGINSGSLPDHIVKQFGVSSQGIVNAALDAVTMLEALNFTDIIVSLKSTDVLQTIEASREFAKRSQYPIHLGLTQSGTHISGVVRTSTAIGALLYEGIGDTLRFSLSDDPKAEVLAAHALLRSLQIRQGPSVYAGGSARSSLDVNTIAKKVEEAVATVKIPLKICIIGSTVEEDELKNADLGVAGEGDQAILYKHGKRIGLLKQDEIIPKVLAEVRKLVKESGTI